MNAAAKLEQVFDVTTNGNIHLSVDPHKPDIGTIVDLHGEPITRPNSMMVRIDEKVREPITLSRGTLWFIGVLLTVIPITVLLLGYIITLATGYQSNISRVTELDGRVAKLESAVAEIQNLKLSMNTIQGDVTAVKKNQEDGDRDRKDILKNMADIRILLAQKQMGGQ